MNTYLTDAIDTGADFLIRLIKAWDKKDIEQLQLMVEALNDYCDAHGINFDQYIDMTDLPSVDIPKDVDTSYPVWAMDENGGMLVGDTGRETMTLAEYREQAA